MDSPKNGPASLGLIIRAPGWAINYSMSYKRARRQFRRHLIEQGVPTMEAYELADLTTLDSAAQRNLERFF